MTTTRPAAAAVPEVESGLSVLRQPPGRSGGVRTLAVDLLKASRRDDGRRGDGRPGPAFWIDARNAASTYALYELAADRAAGSAGGASSGQSPGGQSLSGQSSGEQSSGVRSLDGNGRAGRAVGLDRLRIARAFTVYQHHELARAVVRTATPATPLVVAPNVTSLYADPDVPEWEREELARATLATLDELGRSLSVPVLASVARDDDLAQLAVDRARSEVECRRTDEGYYYSVGDFETTVYWSDGYWQTTIPYWVELCGTVDERRSAPATPDWALAEG